MFSTDPFSKIILSLISLFHSPLCESSLTKYLFTSRNSPESVCLLYIFEVCIWNVSVLPNIMPVDAVGMQAVVKEFLTPCSVILVLSVSQSHFVDGLTFQRSN